MTPADEFDADQVHKLMMAALDGECSEADRRELDAQLARRPDLRDEWKRLSRVKEVTMSMDIARPPEEVWDRFRMSVTHRAERGLAWTLIAVGGAILAASAIVRWLEQWLAMDVPTTIRIASGAVVAGCVLLLVSVLRERWVLSRRDPVLEGDSAMIVTPSAAVAGHRIVRSLGLVYGNAVRARHVGKDILAGLKNLVGGEIQEYTKLMAESREQAIDRMVAMATQRGGNAIVNVGFSTSYIMANASEILVFGAAVVLESE